MAKASDMRKSIADVLRSVEQHERYLALFACVALVVAVGTVNIFMRRGIAVTHKETVLDCHYNGNGAHEHNKDCYDKGANLVCPLEERPAHHHDDSCYTETRELTCGLEEGEDHVHTDACYEVTRELTCGLEETTEEHVHGAGCFKTVYVRDLDGAVVDGPEGDSTADTDEALDPDQPVEAVMTPEDDMPAQVFKEHLYEADKKGRKKVALTVTVKAPQGAFPQRTTMRVKEVEEDDVREQVETAVRENTTTNQQVKRLKAVDITFFDIHGEKIEPAKEIEVKITSPLIRDIEEPVLLHVQQEEGQDDKVEIVGKVELVNEDDENKMIGAEDTLRFTAERFSPYVIVEMDEGDATSSSSSPAGGGGSLPARESDAGVTPDAPPQTFRGAAGDVTVTAKAPEGAFLEGATMTVDVVDGSAIEETVQSTVGGTVAQVSAVEIAFKDADGHKVEPVEPVRITMTSNAEIPRDSEPVVVQVDKGGEASVVRQTMITSAVDEVIFEATSSATYAMVTTLHQTLVASDGSAYTITVNVPPEANVPAGAELAVSEFLENSRGWNTYTKQLSRTLGEEPAHVRLFDISIMSAGTEVQPAVPVSVSIELDNAAELGGNVQAAHFGNRGVEMLEASFEDGSVSFEASSFSVYAVVDVPEPVEQELVDAQEVSELDGNGFYLSVTKNKSSKTFYFMNSIVANGNDRLITKTGANAMGTASVWYFDQVEGTENRFYLYSMVGDVPKYMSMDDAGKMSLTDGPVTAFTVERYNNQVGKFYLYHQVGNSKYGLNMFGGENGKGFAGWTGRDDGSAIVLTVPLTVEDDPAGLDGKTYGLVNYGTGVSGAAMMAKAHSDSKLVAQEALVRMDPFDSDANLYVAQNTDITMWTFDNIAGSKYYLTAELDGQTKYLSVTSSAVRMVDEPDESCVLTVTQGKGAHAGRIRISNESNYAPNLYSGNVANGFGSYNDNGVNEWFTLAELSNLTDEDFVAYTAYKVGVSDATNVPDGAQVVIYTRVWNDRAKRYDFYAIDHEGKLVRAYESGDTVEWIGLRVNNLLWDFTEYHNEGTTTPNYYYELQNTYSKKYLAPRLESGQLLSDGTVGLNLNGRRYGDYYTTILAWDDPYYEYAGYKVEDGRLVSCPLAQAEDFYFAVMHPVEDKLTTVETVDNDTFGITMRMIDYNGKKTNNGAYDKTQTDVMGGTGDAAGLVTPYLDSNGYPTATKTGTSLEQLFTGTTPVNHLFVDSIYEQSGYFEFNSTENFAHLGDDGNFVLYNQIGTIDAKSASRDHGQFMPYNDLTPGFFTDLYTNQTDETDTPLSGNNPRKGERLYGIPYTPGAGEGVNNNANFHFGMEMEASFTQTANGLDAWGHDIIFEFAGDDDMWLFVDGVLVLDLGGVHPAQVGTVNFRTGAVTMSRGEKNTTLRALFEKSYRAQHPDASNADVTAWLDGIFKDGGTVFNDYSTHTMKMLYMERGAGASNLHMRFNLAAVKPGTVVLGKTISGTEEADYSLAEFPYQIYYKSKSDPSERFHLLTETTGEGDDEAYNVTYYGKSVPVKYLDRYTPAGGSEVYRNVFFLKPGQSAEIKLPDDTLEYYIVECGVNTHIYDEVRANDTLLAGETTRDASRRNFAIAPAALADRQQVTYDNHVSDDAMRTLTITKRLYAEDGKTLVDDDPTGFSFRLYLAGENDELTLANMHPYHVKDPDGNYCRWDYETQSFVSLGETDWSQMSAGKREQATHHTSVYGSISKIPANYSVEVRNVIIDAKFMVEERAGEIPAGYAFREYKRVDGTYIVEDGDTINSGTIRANSDPEIEVYNQRGWGLTARKVWSDAAFMDEYDPIYVAVYLKGSGTRLRLLEGSVRQLPSGTTSAYWYFDQLVSGRDFDDYVVREVTLGEGFDAARDVDEDGVVTIADGVEVTPVDNGGKLTVQAKAQEDGEAHSYTYDASYAPGEATGAKPGLENVREDTIFNTRGGIRIVKTDWADEPLADATFTLVNGAGKPVGAAHYTSDANGLVTLAYLANDTYTLNETSAPAGYQGLADGLSITKTDEGIELGGSEQVLEACRYVDDGEDMPTIYVKDRPFTLEAIKTGEGGDALEGVHFALYRQVFDVDGNPVKDYVPLGGYEDLVTDAQGKVPGITESLAPGTYYLTETQAKEGYAILEDDLCFTVGATGTVTIEDNASWGLRTTVNEGDGSVSYVIVIANSLSAVPVKIVKVDQMDEALEGAVFDLSGESIGTLEGLVSTLDAQSGDALVYEGMLHLGTYQLTETKAPDGFLMPEAPMAIEVRNEGTGIVVHASVGGIELAYPKVALVDGVWTVRVTNTTGYELPASGGVGTTVFTLGGAALVLLASVGLMRRQRGC